MSDRSAGLATLGVVVVVAALTYVAGVAGAQSAREWPAWLLMTAGVTLGSVGSAVLWVVWLVRPLVLVARTCDRAVAGDLSQTVQETGPKSLRGVARSFNTMLADFQEVMLLFAYFLRSASTSVQVLRDHADGPGGANALRGMCASTLDDLRQMQAMIEGFRYFRVRFKDGTVTDAGARPGARSSRGGHAAALSARDSQNPGAKRGESGHE